MRNVYCASVTSMISVFFDCRKKIHTRTADSLSVHMGLRFCFFFFSFFQKKKKRRKNFNPFCLRSPVPKGYSFRQMPNTIDQGMRRTRNGENGRKATEERRTRKRIKKTKQNKGAQHLLPNYRFHHIAHKHRKNRLTAQQ